MENHWASQFLPPQTIGEETATMSKIETLDYVAAGLLFDKACERLNDINNWDKLCGVLSADFALMDKDGNPIHVKPSEGDFIRIDIPGPGTKAGNGYDWVKIEKVALIVNSHTQKVYLIQARPSKMPCSDNDNIAHFLTDKATSSFIITLEDNTIMAGVFGRNELPNTARLDNILDKIRNAIVGSSGAIGVSKLQWKVLMDGVIGK